nr:HK97-gp10 family putative phage morphogenesis protein [Brucella anthropi]
MANDNGVARFERRLKAVMKAARAAAIPALEESAGEIVTLMKNLVPVDEGDLRDSIGWTWGNAPKYSMRLGRVKSPDSNLTITIYAGNSKVRYAHFIEFGTRPHILGGMFEGAQHPGYVAHPFFYPAYRSNRKRAARRTTRAMRKAVKEAWNGN